MLCRVVSVLLQKSWNEDQATKHLKPIKTNSKLNRAHNTELKAEQAIACAPPLLHGCSSLEKHTAQLK